MSEKTPLYYILAIIIILMAVSPAFALGMGDRNLLLIGLMGLSPLIIFFNTKEFYYKDSLLLLFMSSIILCPLIFNAENMRWSTVMYSCMFCLTFIAYKQLLYKNIFSIRRYQQILMYLIYAYFIILLIQQFCVLTGLPILNLGNYNLSKPWKLNSLAAEPSHSARIVALLMYCYINTKELILKRKYSFIYDFKSDKWIWIAFTWTMVTMGSGTAFLFIIMVLMKFLRLRSLIPLFGILCIIFILVNIIGSTSYDRTYKIFMATLTLNEDAIIEADHSASFRIVPQIVLAKMINVTTIEGWFGHGIDYVNTFMYEYMPDGGDNVGGGGLLAIAIEYGFLSFSIFSIYTFWICVDKRNIILSIIFWFMLIFMNGINSQIVWLTIILLFTNNVLSAKRYIYV